MTGAARDAPDVAMGRRSGGPGFESSRTHYSLSASTGGTDAALQAG